VIHLDSTEFTISAGSLRIIWEILTGINTLPTTVLAVEELIGKFGVTGIENFLHDAKERCEDIIIGISDGYDTTHTVSFNLDGDIDSRYKSNLKEIDVLVDQIAICLEEFITMQRENNEKDIN